MMVLLITQLSVANTTCGVICYLLHMLYVTLFMLAFHQCCDIAGLASERASSLNWVVTCWHGYQSVAKCNIFHVVQLKLVPSVLWHCWLGDRRGIQPVKNWVVGCWRGTVCKVCMLYHTVYLCWVLQILVYILSVLMPHENAVLLSCC